MSGVVVGKSLLTWTGSPGFAPASIHFLIVSISPAASGLALSGMAGDIRPELGSGRGEELAHLDRIARFRARVDPFLDCFDFARGERFGAEWHGRRHPARAREWSWGRACSPGPDRPVSRPRRSIS